MGVGREGGGNKTDDLQDDGQGDCQYVYMFCSIYKFVHTQNPITQLQSQGCTANLEIVQYVCAIRKHNRLTGKSV